MGYAAFAPFYDAFMELDYDAYAARLLAFFPSPPRSLLDVGCGTGRLTAALMARGVDVIGVDNSEEMLALARERCPEALLLKQDMRALDLYGTVEGAVCALDGVNHLLARGDVAAFLSRLRLFIEPGGFFVFDANTPYKHREVLGNRDFVLEKNGALCAWQNRTKGNLTRMTLDFFAPQEWDEGRGETRREGPLQNPLYTRATAHIAERAYPLPVLWGLLEENGFAVREADDSDSERWVIAAQKM